MEVLRQLSPYMLLTFVMSPGFIISQNAMMDFSTGDVQFHGYEVVSNNFIHFMFPIDHKPCNFHVRTQLQVRC